MFVYRLEIDMYVYRLEIDVCVCVCVLRVGQFGVGLGSECVAGGFVVCECVCVSRGN